VWEGNHLVALLTYPLISAYYQQQAIGRYLVVVRTANRSRFGICLGQIGGLGTWVAAALVLDWQKALLFVVIPQQVALNTVLVFNYLQHVHADEEDPWNHSRNFTGQLLNFFLFNNGYHTIGLDHGVGHPLLLLYDVKAPNGQKSNEFNDLNHYPSSTS
jgi:beta-carotene hydroxylase